MNTKSNLHGFFYRNEKGLNCKIFKLKMKCDMVKKETNNIEWVFTTDETLDNAKIQAIAICKNLFGENLIKLELC